MSKMQDQVASLPTSESWFSRPEVGTALTVCAGLSFLVVCMVLPLVGKAGTVTVHARLNTLAFAAALIVTLGLASLASLSKLSRRHTDQSPRPYFSLILAGLSALLLVALVTGLVRI